MDSVHQNRLDLVEPQPPGWKAKLSGHHWLVAVDSDGREWPPVVLQWNPAVKKWSHSGDVATGMYVRANGWRYLAEAQVPGVRVTKACPETPDQTAARMISDGTTAFHIYSELEVEPHESNYLRCLETWLSLRESGFQKRS